VPSSDRHQVKPWFAGHLDFTPPVPDLSAAGFPLLGGRVDFLDDRRVAVVVYGRRRHLIDVYVLPERDRPSPIPTGNRLGYNLLTWREGDLRLTAISDVEPGDLRLLARAHAAAARASMAEPR
jgi:anti-sigma factor RsiW